MDYKNLRKRKEKKKSEKQYSLADIQKDNIYTPCVLMFFLNYHQWSKMDGSVEHLLSWFQIYFSNII